MRIYKINKQKLKGKKKDYKRLEETRFNIFLENEIRYTPVFIKHLLSWIKLQPVNSEETKNIQFDKCDSKVSNKSKILKNYWRSIG